MEQERIETILYSGNMGEGLIFETEDQSMFRDEHIIVANEILIPGTHTSMSGYFKKSLKYCGVINDTSLVFEIGKKHDLFGVKVYYQVVHWISETRLFSMFSFQAGRDFNFINNKWK